MALNKTFTNIIEKQMGVEAITNNPAGTRLEMDALISSVRPFLEPAWNYEKDGQLQDAIKIYQDQLAKKPNEVLAVFCRQGIMRCQEMKAAFPYGREELWRSLKVNFPDLSRARFDAYLAKGVFLSRRIEGETRYDGSTAANLCYRDAWAREHNPKFTNQMNAIYKIVQPWISGPERGHTEWRPYRLTLKFSAARTDIPLGQTVRLWFPFPLEQPGMKDIKILSVTPEHALINAPDVKAEMGVAYLEAPPPKEGDLQASIQLSFQTRPRTTAIDYDRDQPYDTDSTMYKRFTRSEQHTFISEQVADLARKLTSREKRAARKARILYDYILDNYPYALNFSWRATIFSPFESASETVLKNGAGDCVTQSCFFVALCRSIGIPARVTGGRLFFSNEINDDHFWAEFFLPAYGWIPVDTTVAITLQLVPNLTKGERKAIREYYFGSLDPYRLVTQRSALYLTLEPPKHSERRQGAFLATLVEAECAGQNINKSKLEYVYQAGTINP